MRVKASSSGPISRYLCINVLAKKKKSVIRIYPPSSSSTALTQVKVAIAENKRTSIEIDRLKGT